MDQEQFRVHQGNMRPAHTLTSYFCAPRPTTYDLQDTQNKAPQPYAVFIAQLAVPTQIFNPGLGQDTHSLHLSCWLLKARVNFPPVGHRFCCICFRVFTLDSPLAETHHDVVLPLVSLNHRPHSICFEHLILNQAWKQMHADRKEHQVVQVRRRWCSERWANAISISIRGSGKEHFE